MKNTTRSVDESPATTTTTTTATAATTARPKPTSASLAASLITEFRSMLRAAEVYRRRSVFNSGKFITEL